MSDWKEIKGFENYLINTKGEIKSLPKKTRKSIKILKHTILKNGYTSVDLVKDGKVYKKLTHRLVAESFLENTKNKPQVNHINGIKSDNILSNLEWATRSENQLHSIRIGLRHTRGENNSQVKLTELDVMNILNDSRKYALISKYFNVSISTIADIKRGYSWTHITGLENIKIKRYNNK